MVYVNGVPYVTAADYYAQALALANSVQYIPVSQTVEVVPPQQVVVVQNEPNAPVLAPPQNDEATAEVRQTVAKPAPEEQDWLPMGTFAILDDLSKKESGKVLQVATNKKGEIRGNYVNEATGQSQAVVGAVDSKSQRVAFRFADDDKTVMECGLWNLTQESVPLLIHYSDTETVQKTMIRLTKPEETSAPEVENAP